MEGNMQQPQPQQPLSPQPQSLPPENLNNKKQKYIIAGVVGGIVFLVLMVILLLALTGNKNNLNNNQTNNVADNQNEQQNINDTLLEGTSNNGLEPLPTDVCPDRVFVENGEIRADYMDMPYLVEANTVTWLQTYCSSVDGVATLGNSNESSEDETEPPLLLKSIGFNLDVYNSSTNMAGDIEFTNVSLPFDQIYSPYGQQDPRTADTTKINPQPTVYLPLGTDVLATVDGVIVEVKELYSGDATIWIAKSKNSKWFYEIEHVKDPLVKIGDSVVAGQVIAKVSDYDSHNTPGYGLVEIGILHSTSDGRPEHVCPLKYLDPSIKNSTNSKLMNLYSSWESYIGKEVYAQESFVSAGCVVETPFKE